MSHGSEEEGDFWPGYVDALTAMVKVLSFVMMLLAVAVFVLSQNVSKAMVEKIAKAAKVPVTENIDVNELTQKVVEAIENQDKTPPVERRPTSEPPPATEDTPSQASSERAKALESRAASRPVNQDRKVAMAADAKNIHIRFASRDYKLAAAGAQMVGTFIDENQLTAKQTKLVVKAYASAADASISESRRIAYYRGMIVRKELIARKIRPEDIQVLVEDTTNNEQETGVDVFTHQPAN